MLNFQLNNGWFLTNDLLQHAPSPNFDARPANMPIDLLVIHHIALPPHQFGGDDVIDFFQNRLQLSHPFYHEIKSLKVSAHLFIRRNGKVVQFVSLNDRAWHAGVSSFLGRVACNDFSIGIELEGDLQSPYRFAQYQSLIALTQAIQTTYPDITTKRITGHEHIAPTRKTDPGPLFDWAFYKQQLETICIAKT